MKKIIIIGIVSLLLVSVTTVVIFVLGDNACIRNLNYSKDFNMVYSVKVCDDRVSLINEKVNI